MLTNRISPISEEVRRRRAYDSFVSRVRRAKEGLLAAKRRIFLKEAQDLPKAPQQSVVVYREESLLVREELPPIRDRRNHRRLWEHWMEKIGRGRSFKQKWSDYRDLLSLNRQMQILNGR
ncbi:hypothetical protein SNEBB_011418 [Seison nebaliae]|nr:hypothetical protein SNEBB_011418 [Seison nebaliae]